MSDVSAIASASSSLSQAQLQTQIQVSLLKESLDAQQAVLDLLFETLGVGGQVNLEA